MDIVFWTNDNMATFWGYVKMLLETIQPGIMITVAIVAAGFLLSIIIKAVRKGEKDKDDDEIEIRRY